MAYAVTYHHIPIMVGATLRTIVFIPKSARSKTRKNAMSAPEQHFAFQNPYALEVRFDGLFLVEEEPRGDGEEDDDAHFATTLHDELKENPLRPQRKILSIIAIVNDEMMGENHEHCDDAQ